LCRGRAGATDGKERLVTETWDTIDRYMILSSDTHGGASLYEYRPYLEAAWQNDFDAWAKSLESPYLLMTDAESETMQVNWDSDRRLACTDAEGVTGEVIFPNTLPPFYDVLCHLAGVPWTTADFERRWAGLRAHNRWLVHFCSLAPQRRRGLIQLLPNDIDAAVAEVRWAKDSGVIGGVMIPAIPANHAVQPLFHPRYELCGRCARSLACPSISTRGRVARKSATTWRSPRRSSSRSSTCGPDGRCAI
jgi:hypothetical protein